MKSAFGEWIWDYLWDGGYFVKGSPVIFQTMIMNAIPPIGQVSDG